MKIQPININSDEYQNLYIQIGDIFNSKEWLSIYDKNIHPYGIYNKGGQLIGFFNLFFEKKYGFTHVKNPPYSPTISLYYTNPSQNNAKKHSFDKSMYKLIEEYFSAISSHIITLALPIHHSDMQHFIWKGYKVIPNYTYQLNVGDLTPENINTSFSPERRNDIKKALKEAITCQLSYDYTIVKEMVLHTYKRKGKTAQEKLLDNILLKFATKENSFSFVSYQNKKPIAAAFIIYDKNIAYYLLGGYDPENKHQGAGALAVEQAIYHTKKLGIPLFDFEGSMLPEVERYFRGFGGDMKTIYTINKAKLPIELALKLIDRQRF